MSVCLCGDSGAGGSGSPGGGAAVAAAAARAPALLAAQVWSARHFVRFTKSSSGRSRRERPRLGARPRRRRPPRRAGPRGPAAGSRGPGTAVFAGEGAVASPAPGAAGTASRRETEKAAARPRSRERRGRREAAGAALAAEAAAGAQRREPKAETHRRERRECPAIVPVSVRPGRGPTRPGARLPPWPAAGSAPRPAGRREGPAILGGGTAARGWPPGEGADWPGPGGEAGASGGKVAEGGSRGRGLPGVGAWGPEKAPDLHWSPERRGGGCLPPPPPLPPHPLPPAPPSSLLSAPSSVGTAGVLRKDNARVKKMGLAAGRGAGEGREPVPPRPSGVCSGARALGVL